MNLDNLNLFNQWEILECNAHGPSLVPNTWSLISKKGVPAPKAPITWHFPSLNLPPRHQCTHVEISQVRLRKRKRKAQSYTVVWVDHKCIWRIERRGAEWKEVECMWGRHQGNSQKETRKETLKLVYVIRSYLECSTLVPKSTWSYNTGLQCCRYEACEWKFTAGTAANCIPELVQMTKEP